MQFGSLNERLMTYSEPPLQKKKKQYASLSNFRSCLLLVLISLWPFPTIYPTIKTLPKQFPFSASIRADFPNWTSIVQPGQAIAAVPYRSIQMVRRKVGKTALYLTIIDLRDPNVVLSVGLPHNATRANSSQYTRGVETFSRFVARHPSAAMINGTFFSTDAQKRVMGNMVAGGKVLKFSPSENYGTTLGFQKGNRLEMVTARTDGKPDWDKHWFSLTAGPRLLRKGAFWIAPRKEGFTDPNVMGVAKRSAIGFSKSHKTLFFATFITPISLRHEASIMKSIGCYEAMNLDGGSSTALAYRGKILVKPRRSLANVLMVYDSFQPAPQTLRASWHEFQMNNPPASNN
jgi:exopolysaccharide biosynthesis protein